MERWRNVGCSVGEWSGRSKLLREILGCGWADVYHCSVGLGDGLMFGGNAGWRESDVNKTKARTAGVREYELVRIEVAMNRKVMVRKGVGEIETTTDERR